VKFLDELRHRGILKIATVYLIVSWLVLEVGHTLFNVLDLPHAALKVVFILLTLGFPVALAAGWFYRIGGTPGEQAHGEVTAHGGPQLAIIVAGVALLAIATAIGVRYFGMSHPSAQGPDAHGSPQAQADGASSDSPAVPGATSPKETVFAPPRYSIAVLPFVNMSGDSTQDYFSDGLSEELLNALARLPELQVAARTSSFAFKGRNVDIPTVGRELNVGAVLEGSVRKAGKTVRITVQLISAGSGYRLWSQAYDRDLENILKVQADIASAITDALQVTLLGNPAAKIELGGTRNPDALDAYLRGRALDVNAKTLADSEAALAAYDEAIRLDSNYALAYTTRSRLQALIGASYENSVPAARKRNAAARRDAERAIQLAPELAEGHSALAFMLSRGTLDYRTAWEEHKRATALAPGNAVVLLEYADFAAYIGNTEQGFPAAQQAIKLDPLNYRARRALGRSFYHARRYRDALKVFEEADQLLPNSPAIPYYAALSYLQLGQPARALEVCNRESLAWAQWQCQAIAWRALGKHKAAQAALERVKETYGESAVFQYAEVYASWGELDAAFDALADALKVPDPGLLALKPDPLLDPLRSSPRYKAIEAEIQFP
jgi:TolB-like protein